MNHYIHPTIEKKNKSYGKYNPQEVNPITFKDKTITEDKNYNEFILL